MLSENLTFYENRDKIGISMCNCTAVKNMEAIGGLVPEQLYFEDVRHMQKQQVKFLQWQANFFPHKTSTRFLHLEYADKQHILC